MDIILALLILLALPVIIHDLTTDTYSVVVELEVEPSEEPPPTE